MKRVLLLTGIIIILLLGVGGIWYVFTPLEKRLSYVIPELNNIRLSKIHIGEQKATMQVQFEATSRTIPVFIHTLNYDFRLYGKSIMQGRQNFKSATKTGQVQLITLPVSFDYQKTLLLAQRQVAENTPLEGQFQATGQLSFFGRQSFRMVKNFSLKLPVLLAPTITNLETEPFGFLHLRPILTLAINNPNDFDFYIRQLNMNVQLNNFMASTGDLRTDFLIKARAVTPIKIRPANAITQSESEALTRSGESTCPYSLKASLIIEPINAAMGEIQLDAVKAGIVHLTAAH